MGQLVAGCPQEFRRFFSILGFIDQILGMLDSKAHCKGLWLHRYFFLMQYLKRVSCTVAYCQNCRAGIQLFCTVYHNPFQLSAAVCSFLYQKIGHAGVKPDLAAQADNFVPHPADYLA